MELIGYDANGTDGSDPSQTFIIYRFAGRVVRIPANVTDPAEIKAAIMAEFGITPGHYDTLAALSNTWAALDFTTVTGLTATSTNAELVAAIQTLGMALQSTVAMLRFLSIAQNE